MRRSASMSNLRKMINYWYIGPWDMPLKCKIDNLLKANKYLPGPFIHILN